MYDPDGRAMTTNFEVATKLKSMLAGTIYSSIWYTCKLNESNENQNVFFEGKYWTYRSVRSMSESQYPWATEMQIRLALKKLVEAGYIEKMSAPSGVVRNNTSLYSIK